MNTAASLYRSRHESRSAPPEEPPPRAAGYLAVDDVRDAAEDHHQPAFEKQPHPVEDRRDEVEQETEDGERVGVVPPFDEVVHDRIDEHDESALETGEEHPLPSLV